MHCKLILLNLHRGYFLKQLLTLLSLLMFLIPSVYAKKRVGIEIDGIKFRMANIANEVNFRTTDGSYEDIIIPDRDLEGQKPKEFNSCSNCFT